MATRLTRIAKNTCTQSCRRKIAIVGCCIVVFQIFYSIRNQQQNIPLQTSETSDDSPDSMTEELVVSNQPSSEQKTSHRFRVTSSLKNRTKATKKLPGFYETHPLEAEEIEREMETRKRLLYDTCQKMGELVARDQAAFLKLLPHNFENLLLKKMAHMAYSDDANQLLVCSSHPGVFTAELGQVLSYYTVKRAILAEKVQKELEKKLEKDERELADQFEQENVGKSRKTAPSFSTGSNVVPTLPPTTPLPNEPPTVEGLLSKPLLSFARAEIYSRLKTYRKVAVITEPLERFYTQWRGSIEDCVRSKTITIYDLTANFTGYFYLMTLQPKRYPSQLDACSLCSVDYDYVIKVENMRHELEYVAWKLNARRSDLLMEDNFYEQPLVRLEMPRVPSSDPENASPTSAQTSQPEAKMKLAAYEDQLSKMPLPIVNNLIEQFKDDFSALGYALPDFKGGKALRKEDQPGFMEWQRSILIAQREREKLGKLLQKMEDKIQTAKSTAFLPPNVTTNISITGTSTISTNETSPNSIVLTTVTFDSTNSTNQTSQTDLATNQTTLHD